MTPTGNLQVATPHRTSLELTGADGGRLRVDVRRTPGTASRPAVVICHGFKGFKDWGFFPVLAERLARAGVVAVSFNYSGSGVVGERFSEPDRFGQATFSGDLTDMETVWRAVQDGTLGPPPPPGATGLFGHSRGGGMAVLFAARQPVGALVTWNAIGNVNRWGEATLRKWRADGYLMVKNARTGEELPLTTRVLDDITAHRERLDIPAAATRVTAPWLRVQGGADIVVRPDEWQGPAGELLLIERGTHTFGARHPWAGTTAELDLAMDRTVDWFLRNLET